MRVSLFLLISACGSVSSSPPDAPAPADAMPDFVTSFGSHGLRAAAGSFELLDLSNCCASSCAGNNPSSPYAAWFVPPGPDETTPNPHARADGMSNAFRLRADEAIVFVGTTPPTSRYFGFTPYIEDRAKSGGGRRVVAASVSETLNDLVLHADGARTAIIATGDAGTEAKARDALIAAGFPSSAINTLVFDPALAHFGSDDAADTFDVLFRVALPQDPAALGAYLAHPGAQVWRVTPNGAPSPSPEPSPAPRVKDASNGELALGGSVDALGSAIVAAYPGFTATEIPVDDGVPDPLACISGASVCAFDNRDTTYPATKAGVLFASDDDFYVVYGVDHAVSGKVSYANASVYAVQHLVGVASAASPRFPGSAQQYVTTDAPKLYAYKIARSCGGDPYCLEIPKGACPDGLDNGALGAIAFRTYLEPTTATAPDPSTLVRDRVLRFRPSTSLRMNGAGSRTRRGD
ncbi:MAG TPA: hypothetical protein VL463_35515 [Kofleriaceae bacterium]|nr:hypothetical protein [Kofleriaceae bacterium]